MVIAYHLRTFGESMESSRATFIEHERVDHPKLHPQQEQDDSQHKVAVAIEFHCSEAFP